MRIAALAAALVAAAVVPGAPAGIGVVAVAVLVAAAVARAAKPTTDLVGLGVLALALVSLAAVLDAGWVVALDLVAAWLLASLAVAGPTPAGVIAPLARLRDVPAVAPTAPAGLAEATRGVVYGAAVVVPFGMLFWTADAAFAEIGRGLPLPELETVPGRMVVFALVLAAALGLALAFRRPLRLSTPHVDGKLSRWEWVVPLALLDVLFLAFVVVQVTVLFGGNDHVLRTGGLTYAEYARSGFWQLLVVAALVLVVIRVASAFAHATSPRDRLLLRALLGTLCALTIVVLVSTLHRLDLYDDAYGLTRLRLIVEMFTLWLGAVFVLVIAAGLVARFRRELPRVLAAATGVGLLVFSLANPDGLIAERNLDRWRDSGRLDVSYLQTLSADAAPRLAELPVDLRRRALRRLAADLDRDEPWSSANLSRHRARALLDQSR